MCESEGWDENERAEARWHEEKFEKAKDKNTELVGGLEEDAPWDVVGSWVIRCPAIESE